MKIVLVSDTHGWHRSVDVPGGDVLVHAGDITRHGRLDELAEIDDWLGALPHRHKIVVAGNHDFCFEREPQPSRAAMTRCIYLEDEEVEIDGVRFYGSPWQPWFYDWAFNLQRGDEIRARWDLIPDGIDVLITHGPPLGHGDRTFHGDQVGCADLLDAVHRIGPKVHVFGHIHEGAGITSDQGIDFVNASICNLDYRPSNPAIVYELDVS